MRIVLAFVLALSANYSIAAPEPWMKKENPNELAIWVFGDTDCPFTKKQLTTVVSGVLTRSRIKVLDSRTTEWLHLSIAVDCTEDSNAPPLYRYTVDVHFGSMFTSGRYDHSVSFIWGYDYFGVGGSKSILSAAETQVERAITDYLKANFDL